MTDMSEGPNVSDERPHAEVALEDAAEDARMHFVMGHAIALRIRALKATP